MPPPLRCLLVFLIGSHSFLQATNFNVTNEATLNTAISSAVDNDTITLLNDINGLSGSLNTITTSVTFQGNFTIYPLGQPTGFTLSSAKTVTISDTIFNTAVNSVSTGSVILSSSQSSFNFASGSLALAGGATLTCNYTSSTDTDISLGAGGATLQTNPAVTITINNAITGTGALTKTGTGTLSLQTACTYSGGTTVSAGTITTPVSSNAFGAGAIALGNGTTLSLPVAGTLDNNMSVTGTTTFALSGSRTFNGVISGTGSITKTSTGGLVLNGNNTYSGGTTISAGSITLNHNNAAGTGAISLTSTNPVTLGTDLSIANNISLGVGETYVNASGTGTLSGIISGTGPLRKDNAATLILSGINTYSGGTTLVTGTLTLTNSNAAGTGSLQISGGTLVLSSGVSLSNAVTRTGGTVQVSSGTATLSGIISSASAATLTKTGAGTLVLSGNSTYNGGTVLSAGTISLGHNSGLGTATLAMADATILALDSGISASNAVTVAGTSTVSVASGTGTLSGIISSTGALTKTGSGTLILSGANTYTGATTISAGSLTCTGSTAAASTVTVSSGATLRGTGTIGGNTTVAGTVHPGTSIGTLVISSDLTLNANSVTEIEISPTQSSLIQVTGAATLNGTLDLIIEPGTYSAGTQYTVLTANPISGTFATFSESIDGVNVSLIYSSNAVIVALTAIRTTLSSLGMSGNRLVIVNYINGQPNEVVTGSLNTELQRINLLSLPGRQTAIDQISPTRNASTTFAAEMATFMIHRTLSSRMADRHLAAHVQSPSPSEISTHTLLADASSVCETPADPEPVPDVPSHPDARNWTVWVAGWGQFMRQSEENQTPRFHEHAEGGVLGLEYWGRSSALFGISLGYIQSLLHQAHAFGKGSFDFYNGAIYGMASFSDFYIDLSLLTAYIQYDNWRSINYTGFSATARSHHRGAELSPHVGLRYDFHFPWITIEPYLAVDSAYIYEEGYSESGADPFNMRIAHQNAAMIAAAGGLNVYESWHIASCTCILRESLGYLYRQPLSGDTMTAALINAVGSFQVQAFTAPQHLIAPSCELVIKNDQKGLLCSFAYEGEFGDSYRSSDVVVKMGYSF